MVCKIVFYSEFLDIPDNAGKVTRRRRRIMQVIAKRYALHANAIINGLSPPIMDNFLRFCEDTHNI